MLRLVLQVSTHIDMQMLRLGTREDQRPLCCLSLSKDHARQRARPLLHWAGGVWLLSKQGCRKALNNEFRALVVLL